MILALIVGNAPNALKEILCFFERRQTFVQDILPVCSEDLAYDSNNLCSFDLDYVSYQQDLRYIKRTFEK